MKTTKLFCISLLITIFFISTSCSNDNDTEPEPEVENLITVPYYMKGCKYNDNDYQSISGNYLYLRCYYKEENGVIKMSLYEFGSGTNIGSLVTNYTINLSTAQINSDYGPYIRLINSNGIDYKFEFNNDPIDQNEIGFISRVSVYVEDHIIHFKPVYSCSYVDPLII
jgi:hypothetical protein